MDKSKEL